MGTVAHMGTQYLATWPNQMSGYIPKSLFGAGGFGSLKSCLQLTLQ